MPPATQAIKMLVVDGDDAFARMLTTLMSNSADVENRVCRTGAEAAGALCDGFAPDVIVVADSLPGDESGIRLCRRILDVRPECKAFLVSASSGADMDEAARDAGIVEVFSKPCDFKLVIDAMLFALRGEGGGKRIEMTQYPLPSTGQIDRLRGAIEQRPDDENLRQLLAFSLYMAQRYKEAAIEYEALARAGYCTYLTDYYAGNAYARLQKYQEAIECWMRAREAAPQEDVVAKIDKRIEQARTIVDNK